MLTRSMAAEWAQHAYKDQHFAVAFPADPKVTTTPYTATDGTKTTKVTYTARQDDGLYEASYIDLTNSKMDAAAAIGLVDYAAPRTLGQSPASSAPRRSSAAFTRLSRVISLTVRAPVRPRTPLAPGSPVAPLGPSVPAVVDGRGDPEAGPDGGGVLPSAALDLRIGLNRK